MAVKKKLVRSKKPLLSKKTKNHRHKRGLIFKGVIGDGILWFVILVGLVILGFSFAGSGLPNQRMASTDQPIVTLLPQQNAGKQDKLQMTYFSGVTGVPTPTKVPTPTPTLEPDSASGVPMPSGDQPGGWKQIFADDFTLDAPLGSWATSDANKVVYTGAQGGKWVTYPDGWPCTGGYPGCEAGAYMPSQVLSVQNGVLNFKLATINGRPRGANPSPLVTGSSQYQTYGRYTFRFKVDQANLSDWHVAWLFWPQSNKGNCGGDGEEDFPEGRLSEEVGGFHHYAIVGCGQDAVGATGARFTDWHTYTIEWKPGNIKYILDDKVVLDSSKHVPNKPMRFQLQTEIKNGPGEPSGNLLLDWVVISAYQP